MTKRIMTRWITIVAVILALGGVTAACSSNGSSGKKATLTIVSPTSGATTGTAFVVQVKSSVPLGTPGTGQDHVHVWFDGHNDQYTIGYGDKVQINGVTPGQHTMTVSLRNPNHSAVGVDKTISITVSSAGPTQPSTAPSTTGGSGGYGY